MFRIITFLLVKVVYSKGDMVKVTSADIVSLSIGGANYVLQTALLFLNCSEEKDSWTNELQSARQLWHIFADKYCSEDLIQRS